MHKKPIRAPSINTGTFLYFVFFLYTFITQFGLSVTPCLSGQSSLQQEEKEVQVNMSTLMLPPHIHTDVTPTYPHCYPHMSTLLPPHIHTDVTPTCPHCYPHMSTLMLPPHVHTDVTPTCPHCYPHMSTLMLPPHVHTDVTPHVHTDVTPHVHTDVTPHVHTDITPTCPH